MIIDRARLAGHEAYLKDASGNLNLSGTKARTPPLARGKQLAISGIEIYIEAEEDLTPLLRRQSEPLIVVNVVKEMFPALFANPFAHRVHTLAGFDDFNRGRMQNCKAIDVNGVPTLVSHGTETCRWVSPRYPLGEALFLGGLRHTLVAAAWELALSRRTLEDSFAYSLEIKTFDESEAPLQTIALAAALDPTRPRFIENLALQDAAFYEVSFLADVRRDASLQERHSTIVESLGTPLLRAINLLEPVENMYRFHSLQELLSQSSEYHLFEHEMHALSGIVSQPLRRMTATLNISATLVQSDQDDGGSGRYEQVEIAVPSGPFRHVEARMQAEVWSKCIA